MRAGHQPKVKPLSHAELYIDPNAAILPKTTLKKADLLKVGPLHPQMARKLFRRHVDPRHIHWRNTALLSQCLTEYSFLKNRWQTRLGNKQQRMVSRAVRTARKMGLFCTLGLLKASDRMSLTSVEQDIENSMAKSVDLNTGMIVKGITGNKWKGNASRNRTLLSLHSLNSDSNNNDANKSQSNHYKNEHAKIQDNSYDFRPFIPNINQRELASIRTNKNLGNEVTIKKWKDKITLCAKSKGIMNT